MSDVNHLHRVACVCEECESTRKRFVLLDAVVTAAMHYTGPPPHASSEHHDLVVACEALRVFRKERAARLVPE